MKSCENFPETSEREDAGLAAIWGLRAVLTIEDTIPRNGEKETGSFNII